MDTLLQNLRFAFRMLWKSPGFTAVAVLTLALGIGANTAIFSIVNAVLLQPLPFRDAGQLVRIVPSVRGLGLREIGLSQPEYEDLRSRAGIFDDVAVTWPVSANLTGGDHPERIELLGTSPNYFTMLGVQPQLGRVFGPQDEAPGFADAVVISDGVWHRLFGGDPNVIGRKLRLDSDLYTVVGVAPAGFRHPGRTVANDVDIFASAGYSADPFPKPARNIRLLPGAIARLKPGISMEQARARLSAFSSELLRDYPQDYPTKSQWTIDAEPLQEAIVGKVRPMLLLLMGAVVLTILIASVNIANLLLARASFRQREIGVRLALGASRGQITLQMLTESLLLAVIAGVVAILACMWSANLLVRLAPSQIPRLHEVSINGTVLGFSLFLSVLTGILFGLAPALHLSKLDLFSTLREGGRGGNQGQQTNRIRSMLITSEIALAVVLMIGAGLLLRTFWDLLQEDPGFNPSRVASAAMWIPVPNNPKADPYAKPESVSTFAREVLRRIQALPEIESAAVTSNVPLSGRTGKLPLIFEETIVPTSEQATAEIITVTPNYFTVMQTSLVRGRFFTESDDRGKPPVVLIDQSTARRFWPNQEPIGKRIQLGQPRPSQQPVWLTIVGIVGDMKYDGLELSDIPHVYAPMYQLPFSARVLNVVVRSGFSIATLETEMRREIQAVDPNLPVFNVQTMNAVIGRSLESRRFSATLVGSFALVALLLASVGIYGVLAYLVNQRRQEIGLRMALGARPVDIRRLILGQGLRLTLMGVVIGTITAALAARLISSLLFGVHPLDPLVFTGVPVSLGLVALLASYLPARRAMQVDPMIAIRSE